MDLKKRLISWLLLFGTLLGMLPSAALGAWATGSETPIREDAMKELKRADSLVTPYQQGETQVYENDGVIGIPYEITVYYDASKGAATPGYQGTPAILYVVNSGAERVGTDSDESILLELLGKGYIVAVLDYKNNEKAVRPTLESSAQVIRALLKSGSFFKDKTLFPDGTYYENHVVPAGHTVSLDNVYYEIDKHGADGELEKIVETWNYDFRSCRAETVIKWVDPNGVRKSTQNGFDGSSPIWYADAAGKTVDQENGQYIRVKHTWAKTIGDCVKKDGTLIDLNLYMHIIYPTNPDKKVPVMVLSGSSEHLAGGYSATDRPHLIGFAMNGYAVATYDFEYIPMARDDHYGYFAGDATGGLTGINNTFALGIYTSSSFNTAAMRYLRYLSYTQPSVYRFRDDAIGVYGNSKGANQTFLGEASLQESITLSELGADATAAELEEYLDHKVTNACRLRYIVVMDPEEKVTVKNGQATRYETFDGDSRYQNGKTDEIRVGDEVIDGGTLQPWLTYTDKNGVLREIPSGAQLVYSSCGGTTSEVWEGHSPVFTTSNLLDSWGSAYSTQNYIANLLRIYDVPSLYFELTLEHALVKGTDLNYGVDAYQGFFHFCDYYLKDSAVRVAYADPSDGAAGISTTDSLTVKFYGEVTAEEIKKVTLTDQNGNVAEGEWSSAYGRTEWSFSPKALMGGMKYTLNVPSELKGANGKPIAEEFSLSFYTEGERNLGSSAETVTVTDKNGAYFHFVAPGSLSGKENRVLLRFHVGNDAANVVGIYTVEPGSNKTAKKLGTVNLKGSGYYEYDVTETVMQAAKGTTVSFCVKAEKAAADQNIYVHEFDTTADLGINQNRKTVTEVKGQKVTAVEQKIPFAKATTSYGVTLGYAGWYPTVLSASKLIDGGRAMTEADYGRRFTVTLRLYDTASRALQLWWNDCSSQADGILDYDYTRTAIRTVAGEWMEITVPYTVYEMDYGVLSQSKIFKVIMYSTGASEMPIYYDRLTVTEEITDVTVTEGSLVAVTVGNNPYKTPTSEKRFEGNGISYASWGEALKAAESQNSFSLRLLGDVTLGASDAYVLTSLTSLTLDLNGYVLALDDTSLFCLEAKNKNAVSLTVKNGTLVVSDHAVVSHTAIRQAGNGKSYDIAFERVSIAAKRGAATQLLCESVGEASGTVTEKLRLTDCEITLDRSKLPRHTDVTLFPSGMKGIQSSYELIGGTLQLSSFLRCLLSEELPVLRFKKNAASEYLTLTVPGSVTVSADMSLMTDVGYTHFEKTASENGYDRYELTSAKYSTPYGIIPEDKSPEEYPFALFADGELIGLYGTYCNGNDSMKEIALYAVWSYIRGEHDKVLQLYLRRDYDMGADGAKDTFFNNFSQIGGTLVIDLGGNTLSLGNVPLIPFTAKHGWDSAAKKNHIYDTSVIVRNGTVVSDQASMILYESMVTDNAGYDKKKQLDVLVEQVTVRSSVPLVKRGNGVNSRYGAELALTMTDCILDLTEITNDTVLFDALDGASKNDLKVRLCGGDLRLSSLAPITLLRGDDRDELLFRKNASGKHMTLTMPSEAKLSTLLVKDDAGRTLSFGNGVAKNGTTVYTLSEYQQGGDPLVTKYGVIPEAYASTEDYPFAVFSGGQFIAAFGILVDNNDNDGVVYNGNKGVSSALEQARAILVGSEGGEAQILLRRNYTYQNSENGYNNLSHMDGALVIDLNGFTLYHNKTTPIFYTTAKQSWSSAIKKDVLFPSTIRMINGELHTKSALVAFCTINSSKYESASGMKDITYSFEGVKIVYQPSTYTALLAHPAKNEPTHTKNAFFRLKLTDCTLDLTALAKGTLPLAIGVDAVGNNNLLVEMNGGSIVTEQLGFTLGEYDAIPGADGDSLTFGNGKDGGAKLYPGSVKVPTDAFPTADGKVYFKPMESGEGYILAPCTHVYDNDCDSTCNTCGAVRVVDDHSYEKVGSNETEHWKECACGAVDEGSRAAHSFDNGRINTDGSITYTCGDCQYTVTSDELCKLGMEFDGEHYTYLGKSGEWVRFEGGFCYFNKDGHLMINTEAGKCVFGKYGYLVDGSVEYEGYTYMYIDGAMQKSCVASVGAYCYRFDELGRGTRVTDVHGITEVSDNGKVYVKADGRLLRSGWVELDGEWYFFGKDYKMAVGTVVISGVSFEFGADGKCETELGGLAQRDDGSTVYITDNGTLLRSGWVQLDGKWYYFNRDNEMVKGCTFKTADDGEHTFDENGACTDYVG